MNNYIKAIVATVLAFICLKGCLVSQIPPVKKFAETMIGASVEDLVEMNTVPQSYASKIGWVEKKYSLESGNWVYITPIRDGCLVHWEIDLFGVIVDYKTEGERCY